MSQLLEPELDIVIPVFNEAENIIPVMDALATEIETPHRVLICYDSDDDDTLTALAGYDYPGTIDYVKNPSRGPHSAIVAGFRHGRSKAVLVFPADDTFNASIVDRMYQSLEQGNEIAVASRFMKGGSLEGCPWLKRVLVRTASWTLFHVARLPVRDATNGMRMFSRRVLDTIPIESSEGFTYGLELTAKGHRLGLPFSQVPARWRERLRGTSRFRVYRWMLPYLRWYFYAFATTFLRRRKVRGATWGEHHDGAER